MTTSTQTITAENVLRLFPEVNTTLASSHRGSTNHADLQGYDEEQVRLMEEVCIVLDEHDSPIGSASKKTCKDVPSLDAKRDIQLICLDRSPHGQHQQRPSPPRLLRLSLRLSE